MENEKKVRIETVVEGKENEAVHCDTAMILAIQNTGDIRDALLKKDEDFTVKGVNMFLGMNMPDEIFIEIFARQFAEVLKGHLLDKGGNKVEVSCRIHEAAEHIEQYARDLLLDVTKEDLEGTDVPKDTFEAIGLIKNLKDTLDCLKELKNTFDKEESEE